MFSHRWSGCVTRLFPIAAWLAPLTIPASAQIFTALRVEGSARIVEGRTARYTATAEFDTGKEFDVTLSSTWLVDPDTYADFDFPGRLVTREVPADQAVVVNASFTWDGITKSGALDVIILDNPPEDSGPDPWPTWGRTTTRVGNTTTIGSRTPRIEWSVQADFWVGDSVIYSSCSMDAHGRIFQGQLRGITAVDSSSREVLWVFEAEDLVDSCPTVVGNRVYWGVTAQNGLLRCSDAATGVEIWRASGDWGFRVSPVFDVRKNVYFNDQRSNIYARSSGDGAELWRVMLNEVCYCPIALDSNQILLGGKNDKVAALMPGIESEPWVVDWVFDTNREVFGTVMLTDDAAYIGSTDRYLYAVDRADGHELWRFYLEQSNRGSVALGHDGTVYASSSGSVGWLFAISQEGTELWRFPLAGFNFNPPVVDGNGTIYICVHRSVNREGWVQAIRPDGTELWTKPMPDMTVASPMLAPDGTLYVMCRDKFLYAFRDPAGDLNYDQRIDLADYASFDTCMTDPRIWGTKANTAPGCELLDFDRDWDVDLADYAAFQNRMGTPAP